MTKQTLSDMILANLFIKGKYIPQELLKVEDVKEFIKKLHEEINSINAGNWSVIRLHLNLKIDKLAGESLVEK